MPHDEHEKERKYKKQELFLPFFCVCAKEKALACFVAKGCDVNDNLGCCVRKSGYK